MTSELRRVQVAAIGVSSLNTRKNLEAGSEDAGIEELARSIQQNGLIQPPSLRDLGDGTYAAIAGQRRVMACQRLGLTDIDAFIVDWDDDSALGASLVENLQRADMDPMDKARGLDELVRRLGSEQEAAKSTGLSVGTVRKYLRLLELPEDLRAQLGTGQGPSGVGAMSALARNFGNDPDQAREAWELLGGFKSGTAEDILRQSEGDMGRLGELREMALRGELGVVRCGSSLSDCPWVTELPDSTRLNILALGLEA
jgi:ParB family chromosome partitioning protein